MARPAAAACRGAAAPDVRTAVGCWSEQAAAARASAAKARGVTLRMYVLPGVVGGGRPGAARRGAAVGWGRTAGRTRRRGARRLLPDGWRKARVARARLRCRGPVAGHAPRRSCHERQAHAATLVGFADDFFPPRDN